jgi:leucyl aminopeptidase
MALAPVIRFSKPQLPSVGTVVILVGEGLAAGPGASGLVAGAGRATSAAGFAGKAQAMLDIVAPAGSELDRILMVGLGAVADLDGRAWLKLGGVVGGKLKELKAKAVTVLAEMPDGEAVSADDIAEFALGLRLRFYEFDSYKTKKPDEPPTALALTIAVRKHEKARLAFAEREAIATGVELARDVVNEPPNVLGTEEFAAKAEALREHGVAVEVLGAEEMRKHGMGAFLGVAQGSHRPPLIVVLKWNGASEKHAPVAFVGKGVVFDSGGISIKPGGGMEDMKGDMGGAAAVIGLITALALRKAKVNAVGLLALVENMPDGDAQRPGDIVTTASGQTIEIINTDAEGRLILADTLWYAQEIMKPAAIIDLATLTGACIVALGQHHAGLFSNDDVLAERLHGAGEATGEKVWRLPLGPEYDKMIDSKFADMKNTGGRHAGAITAAQLLKRFVGDVPWAHLDIAGTAMGSPDTEISRSWASGFGVRLLERLVADHYERRK